MLDRRSSAFFVEIGGDIILGELLTRHHPVTEVLSTNERCSAETVDSLLDDLALDRLATCVRESGPSGDMPIFSNAEVALKLAVAHTSTITSML